MQRILIVDDSAAARQREADSSATVEVRSDRDGEWLLVTVRDTGVGIDNAHKPHLFDPFFTTHDVGDGLGQGLTMARAAIVDEHGGQLDFESEQGEGSTFTVRLPLSTPT